jgi:hypothetical protein
VPSKGPLIRPLRPWQGLSRMLGYWSHEWFSAVGSARIGPGQVNIIECSDLPTSPTPRWGWDVADGTPSGRSAYMFVYSLSINVSEMESWRSPIACSSSVGNRCCGMTIRPPGAVVGNHWGLRGSLLNGADSPEGETLNRSAKIDQKARTRDEWRWVVRRG